MIKKIMLIFVAVFLMTAGISTLKINFDTTTVRAEVVNRNIEKHTINVETIDNDANKSINLTLKKVSKAQMTAASKGGVFAVTYDDNFNLKAIKKVTNASEFDRFLYVMWLTIVWGSFLFVIVLIFT